MHYTNSSEWDINWLRIMYSKLFLESDKVLINFFFILFCDPKNRKEDNESK